MRVFCLTPWNWKPHFDWFRRDLGLLVDGLRQEGVEARLVLHHTKGMPEDERWMGVEPSDLKDSSWWTRQAPKLVIALAGTRPGLLPVITAITAAGIPVWNKMDTDGTLGSTSNFRDALYQGWWRGKSNGHALPGLRSLLMQIYWRTVSQRGDKLAVRILEPARRILVESPIATARVRRFFRRNARRDLAERVVWFPSAVSNEFAASPTIVRKRQIISIARWGDFQQKDAPLMMATLREVLTARPDYHALLIGSGEETLRDLAREDGNFSERLTITGRLPGETLVRHYQESRIFLNTSRGEGFPNAIAEAVCSGCSVVGPSSISSLHYFTGKTSGTLATSRWWGDLADATLAEIEEWELSLRAPLEISKHFRGDLSPASASRRILQLLASDEETARS